MLIDRILLAAFARVKDASHLERAMNVSPAYLKHEKEGEIPDYRVSLSG